MFIDFCSDSRREAAQVHRVPEGLQPELQPDHAHEEAHGLQALRLRALRSVLPAEGGPATPSGEPPRGGCPAGGHQAPGSDAAQDGG